MKIKILADGHTEYQRKKGIWGISLLAGKDILFDAFCGGKTLLNAFKKNNENPLKIRHIIISHNHWDHTGGLWDLLEINKRAVVYLCAHSPAELKKRVRKAGAGLVLTGRTPVRIKPGAIIPGEIKGYYKKKTIYEQALLIGPASRRLLICGCSHPGPEEMLRKAAAAGGKVRGIMGGFHLYGETDERISDVIDYFRLAGIGFALPMHCSGRGAVKMKRIFRNGKSTGADIS